jgi:flotillin
MVYTIASPDEYLAITGAGIKTVKITKSAWIWPFQRCQRFCIQPRDYSLSLQAMSKEKLQFMLPVVFTVGPDVNQRGATIRQIVKVPRRGSNGQDELQDIIEEFPEDKGDALVK